MTAQVPKRGLDFGGTPFPVPKAGMKPVVPLGGESVASRKLMKRLKRPAVEIIAFVQDRTAWRRFVIPSITSLQ